MNNSAGIRKHFFRTVFFCSFFAVVTVVFVFVFGPGRSCCESLCLLQLLWFLRLLHPGFCSFCGFFSLCGFCGLFGFFFSVALVTFLASASCGFCFYSILALLT